MTTIPDSMTEREARALASDLDRAREAIVNRHPAFGAHERFVGARLAQLAHRAYQAGHAAALTELRTTEQAAAELGVTRAWINRLAARHDIGWRAGRDRLFLPADIERLRAAAAAAVRTGRPKATPGR